MDASVTWNGKMSFTGTADSGFPVLLDSDPGAGGENRGFRPLELVAVGLAGCTAMDVISIMRKKQQDVTGFEVRAHAEQAEDHPHVFTRIKLTYIFYGNQIDPAAVERSIELSMTKYCPANAMLSQVAKIDHTYEIRAAEARVAG